MKLVAGVGVKPINYDLTHLLMVQIVVSSNENCQNNWCVVCLCAFYSIHCFGGIYLEISDGQAPMLWAVFAIIDFPVSLLYMCIPHSYGSWVGSLPNSIFTQMLYVLNLIHGLIGTVWWYFLPRLITPKSLGGLWGKSNNGPQKARSVKGEIPRRPGPTLPNMYL